jgi:hypothetical protein
MDNFNPEKKRLLLIQYLSWQEFDGVIVLSPDWSVDIPLWPQSGKTDELVPKPLLEQLAKWQCIFDSHYRWSEGSRPEGWLSDEARSEWEREAPELVSKLTNALSGKARLIVNLWPITPSSQNRELQEYWTAKKTETKRWQDALDQAGIKLEIHSPFYDESGQRLKWIPEDEVDEP